MITMKDFIAEDDPILRTPAEKVSFPLTGEEIQLTKDMRQFLINSQDEEVAERYGLRAGVGVAAPQLGVSKQIFAVYLMDYDEEGNPTNTILDHIIINPKIIKHSVKQAALKEGEGCLSVPRTVPGIVPRPKRVTFKYQDTEGNEHEMKLNDYEAIITQHEIDHLKGILFYDHINEEEPWDVDENVSLI